MWPLADTSRQPLLIHAVVHRVNNTVVSRTVAYNTDVKETQNHCVDLFSPCGLDTLPFEPKTILFFDCTSRVCNFVLVI